MVVILSVRTSVVVEADLEKVWEALMNLSTWQKWGTVYFEEGFTPKTGDKGTLFIKVSKDEAKPFDVQVLECSKDSHKIHWEGGNSWTFQGSHWFQLFETEEGYTRFENCEDFSGIVPLLAYPVLSHMVKKNYAKDNARFKALVEGQLSVPEE